MRYQQILAFSAILVVLVACTPKPPTGTALYVPFDAFLKDVRAVRYSDYAGRQGVKVRDETAFEEMRAHIFRMYDGVHPMHTFVVDGQLFDCIPVASQPSVRLLKLDRVESPPLVGASTSTSAHPAGKAPGISKAIDSPLRLGLTDPYGNKVSCVSGTFPMARITLETATRFTTLNEFFGKGPGLEGVPINRRGEILPGDGKDHRYAFARQNDVTSFGGNSWLNLWTPTGGFTLSQQWYSGGSGPGQQTVEGGWVVYKDKFNSDKPVLFIFFTADNYDKKKCYNTICEGFVQTNHNWYLGGGQLQHDRWHAVGIRVAVETVPR